jgi:hypothetical protein
MTGHRPRRRSRPAIGLLVAGSLAGIVAAYAWYRTLTFDRPTVPHAVAWYDATGKLIGGDPRSGAGLFSIVIGDRLILFVDPPEGHGPGGIAWIRPASAEGRNAWPIPSSYVVTAEGVAVRDQNTFAVVIHGARDARSGTIDALSVGIAGRDGWLRAPVTVAEWVDDPDPRKSGRPIPLAMSWVGGELEIVLTRPTAEDPYGSSSPVQITRIGRTGQPAVRSQSLGCDCSVIGALPRARHWTLAVANTQRVMLSNPDGSLMPAPELAEWDRYRTDRSALGSLWFPADPGQNRIERDGSLTEPMPPPPGWEARHTFRRLVWDGGVVRAEQLWTRSDERFSLLARRVGERTILTASTGDDLELIGDRLDRLRPTIQGTRSGGFQFGVMLPRAGGGFYWTSDGGEYVALDADLRRVDPRSLRHHLRTRGSVGESIDEPQHEQKLGWSLFGLPILAAVGFAIGRIVRDRHPDGTRGPFVHAPLIAALVLYALSGGATLAKVLPLL